jgi:hypothetical protein
MEHNKVVFESKVREIFESPEIKAIEIEILVKTEDIHPPKTGISVHFCVLSLMAMQN